MAVTYDPRVYELAELFLSDEPNLATQANARELATWIQTAIEDWIETRLRDWRSPVVGEPSQMTKTETLNGLSGRARQMVESRDMEIKGLRFQLERANRIIGWMMPYIGTMCPPSNGLYDLNIHCCENKVPEPGDSAPLAHGQAVSERDKG
jgi:hypothetical protein